MSEATAVTGDITTLHSLHKGEEIRMRTIAYRDALREAIREEMQRDERVYILGEDIAGYGGTYSVTKGLFEEFGEKRVKDTPLAEEVIAGAAIGSALGGLRPVAELMTANFSLLASDQIINSLAKFHYMFGGQTKLPVVIRMPGGGGAQRGAQHSQMLETMYAHIPGLKVVMPATPYDAKGMLKAAIRDDDPVLFIEHELLYAVKGEVPEVSEEYTVPLNRGTVRREGTDVTIVTFSRMVHLSMQAADALEKESISAEVIDLRSVRPIDLELVLDSLRKTNRVVVAEEGWKYYGTGQGLAALIYEHGFDYLDAPIGHVTGKDVPMPYSKPLEHAALPTYEDVVMAVKAIVPARVGTRA
jgi:pyruvate dehydrogenase E1 component beta subunit